MPHQNYSGQDIYCDEIIPGKRKVEVVHETGNVLAFHHTNPRWPIHIVVIPKKHIPSLTNIPEEDMAIFEEVLDVVREVARQVIEEHGAARVLTNLGDYQDSKHLHFHINFGESL